MPLDTAEPDMLDLSEADQLALLTAADPDNGDLPGDPAGDPPQTQAWTPEEGFVA